MKDQYIIEILLMAAEKALRDLQSNKIKEDKKFYQYRGILMGIVSVMKAMLQYIPKDEPLESDLNKKIAKSLYFIKEISKERELLKDKI